MSEIQQRLPPPVNPNPVHPNAKTTTHVNNGTTTTKTNITSPICRNCKTQTTPLWRRDETGQVLCNACGLFLKLHGRPRPISLKTDTIKSRNRIKQPNSSKSSGPNTPELKSKDSKAISSSGGKKSPKSKKKSTNITPNTSTIDSNNLMPLLPASNGTRAQQNQTQPSNQLFPHPVNTFHHHHLPNHLSHQVQPLHYPSSTPTQFAPGLQRITSPLLLSTSSSISNARSSSSNNGNLSAAAQAAGALENMSNELGPSATFKTSSSNSSVNGISLMNSESSSTTIKKESPSMFSTPSSALNVQSHPLPPKLPALGSNPNSGSNTKTISSPSFGPQFHLQQSSSSRQPGQPQSTPASSVVSQNQSPDSSTTSLPPIHQVALSASNKTPLPHFQNSFGSLNNHQEPIENTYQQHPNNSNNNNSNINNNNNNSNSNGQDNNNNNDRSNSGSNHEITLLKTRISELELVNDLYRTRIMELEAMEQAARLRENSMRKRIDEILSLQEKPIPSFKRENEDQFDGSTKKAKLDN